VPLAVLGLAAWAYPHLHGAGRAAVALLLGVFGGVASVEAVHYPGTWALMTPARASTSSGWSASSTKPSERSRDEHPQLAPLSSQNPQVARTTIGSTLEARRW
jgi:hypothetical protein